MAAAGSRTTFTSNHEHDIERELEGGEAGGGVAAWSISLNG